MNRKIIPFLTRPIRVDESDVLWLVGVHHSCQEEYSCEYKSSDGRWIVHVQSKTFAGAIALVEQCRRAMGLDQSVSGETASPEKGAAV